MGLRTAGARLEEGAMLPPLRYAQKLRPSVASLDRMTAGRGVPTARDPGAVATWKRGPEIWLPQGVSARATGGDTLTLRPSFASLDVIAAGLMPSRLAYPPSHPNPSHAHTWAPNRFLPRRRCAEWDRPRRYQVYGGRGPHP
eukprot:7862568-Pyramimonas_sp.AAC.1